MNSPATRSIVEAHQRGGLAEAMRTLAERIKGADDIADDIHSIADELDAVKSATLVERIAIAIHPSIQGDPYEYKDEAIRAINELCSYFLERGNTAVALQLKSACYSK